MVEHRASPVCTKVCCSFLDVRVRSSLTWVKFAPCMCSSVAASLACVAAYRSVRGHLNARFPQKWQEWCVSMRRALAGASEPTMTISAGFIPRLVRLMHCATDRAAEPGPWLLPEGCRAIARTTGLPRSRHRTRGEAGGGARGGRNLAHRD